MAFVCFIASISHRDKDVRIVLAIASIPIFALLALASFNVELIDVPTAVITEVYSSSIALIYLIFIIISLINSFNLITYAFRNTDNPFDRPLDDM